MTPERLAKYRAKATEAPWGTDFRADMLNLLDHIRDLEAQVRELSDFKEQFIDKEVKWLTAQANWIAERNKLEAQVREAREAWSLAYLELGDGAHPGFREANRAAMAVYERYFDHHDPTGKTIHELREAALATATPPSPEVGT